MAVNTFRLPVSCAAVAAGILVVLVVWTACSAAEEWRVHEIRSVAGPERVYVFDDARSLRHVRIRSTEGSWVSLRQCGRTVCAELATKGYEPPPVPAGALPDAEVAVGTRGVLRSWLAAPTRRYAHGVLGDAIEAGALVAVDKRGARHQLELPIDSVFEDRKPRLADLDGDGQDEILVVRSYLERGAALAVVELTRHGLEIAAEGPAIGRPNRWLNPAGVADFDGDGRLEIAIVVTPHIGGTLEIWEYRAGKLTREAQLRGFSNHAIGSRVQDMSAVGDFDGDGVADLALPSADRRTLRLVSMAGGRVAELPPIKLPGRAVTEIVAVKPSSTKRPALVVGLDNGKLILIK